MGNRKKFCPICLQEWENDDGFCRACGVQLVRTDPDDITGFLVDRKYRVDAIIARGGMGVVYRATQVYLNRDVALKVLRADLPKDANATRRFLLEARAACALRSPHTVTVHDFGISDDGRLYFAMELLDGEPLDRILARGPLAWERVAGIVLQVCDSLGEAHSQRIFHRDIKPANIFLARTTGGTDFVKVLDFGIARIGEETGLTKPGGLCGTPEYASPEQAIGGEADHRSDIYSLGIVAYEMLCGAKPFVGAGPKILMAHVRERPKPLAEVCTEGTVPPAVDEVVQWMLEKLPSRRPQSTAEVAEAFHRIASNQGIPLHLAAPILVRSATRPPPEATPLPTPLKSILEPAAAAGKLGSQAVEDELNEIIDARLAEPAGPSAVSPPSLPLVNGNWEEEGIEVPRRESHRPRAAAIAALAAGLALGTAIWAAWPHVVSSLSDGASEDAASPAVTASAPQSSDASSPGSGRPAGEPFGPRAVEADAGARADALPASSDVPSGAFPLLPEDVPGPGIAGVASVAPIDLVQAPEAPGGPRDLALDTPRRGEVIPVSPDVVAFDAATSGTPVEAAETAAQETAAAEGQGEEKLEQGAESQAGQTVEKKLEKRVEKRVVKAAVEKAEEKAEEKTEERTEDKAETPMGEKAVGTTAGDTEDEYGVIPKE